MTTVEGGLLRDLSNSWVAPLAAAFGALASRLTNASADPSHPAIAGMRMFFSVFQLALIAAGLAWYSMRRGTVYRDSLADGANEQAAFAFLFFPILGSVLIDVA